MDATPICMGDEFEPTYGSVLGVKYILRGQSCVMAVILERGSHELKIGSKVGVISFGFLPFIGIISIFERELDTIYAHLHTDEFGSVKKVRVPVQYLTPLEGFDASMLAHKYDYEVAGTQA